MEDLLDIYILFIRSVVEYCAVAFHSSLTQQQSNKLERIQKTSLRVILGDMYVDYAAALEMSGLQTLTDRRLKRCLDFSRKCLKHPRNKRLFPLNPSTSEHFVRNKELFHVNFARTNDYKDSSIPFCQRLLNEQYWTTEYTFRRNLIMLWMIIFFILRCIAVFWNNKTIKQQ